MRTLGWVTDLDCRAETMLIRATYRCPNSSCITPHRLNYSTLQPGGTPPASCIAEPSSKKRSAGLEPRVNGGIIFLRRSPG